MQYQLDAEKEVLKQLEKQYRTALNDINRKIEILQADELTQSRIYRIEHQKALKAQTEAILEKLHSDEYSTIEQFLSQSYTDAFVGVAYDLAGQGIPLIMPIDPREAVKAIQTESKISGTLYEVLGVDTKNLKKSISAEISRGIAGGMSTNEIARNISNATKAPVSRAKTIVRTESHRIQQASCLNAQRTAKSKGANVVKMWDATMDGDTRPTHRHLDGQIREVDEPFEMDGKSAMYPGDFGDPAEDCNCRCQCLQRAKWALDEKELQTLKDRAEFFGLSGTKNFDDFKEKYLKAIENTGKSGIIKVSKIVYGHDGTPKKSEPNTVIDHIDNNGAVDVRSFYGASGLKERDIHTNDHGNPKWHKFGSHGEHAHDYQWNDDGSLKTKTTREVTRDETERNGDIL